MGRKTSSISSGLKRANSSLRIPLLNRDIPGSISSVEGRRLNNDLMDPFYGLSHDTINNDQEIPAEGKAFTSYNIANSRSSKEEELLTGVPLPDNETCAIHLQLCII